MLLFKKDLLCIFFILIVNNKDRPFQEIIRKFLPSL